LVRPARSVPALHGTITIVQQVHQVIKSPEDDSGFLFKGFVMIQSDDHPENSLVQYGYILESMRLEKIAESFNILGYLPEGIIKI